MNNFSNETFQMCDLDKTWEASMVNGSFKNYHARLLIMLDINMQEKEAKMDEDVVTTKLHFTLCYH